MASASKKDREEEQVPTPPPQDVGDDSDDEEEYCSRYETAGNHLESLQREQDLWKDSEEDLAGQRWADSVLEKNDVIGEEAGEEVS